MVGGSSSSGSAGGVVTTNGSLMSDQLPAESRALTVKVWPC
jgi:hypothetical protein